MYMINDFDKDSLRDCCKRHVAALACKWRVEGMKGKEIQSRTNMVAE